MCGARPARVGLLNETLRRNGRTKRSLDADLSVIALGRQDNEVIGTGFTGKDPTGPDSPFQRVIEFGGVLVGLGVSSQLHEHDPRAEFQVPCPLPLRNLLRYGLYGRHDRLPPDRRAPPRQACDAQ